MSLPKLLFVDVDFADLVQHIMVDRWNSFNTPLHTLAHALNPKFYDEENYGNREVGRGRHHIGIERWSMELKQPL